MRQFLTPRWLASHVFVATLIAAFLAAGVWQLGRLDERQESNARIVDRMDDATVELSELISLAPAEAEYRLVEAVGEYGPEEIYVANRSDDGQPGSWVWTRFRSADGVDILVNRGFVSRPILQETTGALSVEDTAAAVGPVTLVARVREGIGDGRLSTDGAQITRPDAATAAASLGMEPTLDPNLYLEVVRQDPAPPAGFPRPLPEPDLGEGPHLAYAFQWFTFATLGAIGYGLVLRRIRRGDETRGDVPHRLD